MISIITPAHKIIPWYNARLVNVCSQSFSDWEWVILDNSKDGCVKDYIERFFTEMQGIYYPQCKDKIKVYHEPKFADISLADGKMGMLCNRLVELTSCGNDSFFFRLDFDDFIYQDTLSMLDAAIKMYPQTEFVTGQICDNLNQTPNGYFHSFDYMDYWNMPPENLIRMLERNNWDKLEGFSEYASKLRNGDLYRVVLNEYNFVHIPYIEFEFNSDRILALKKGWGVLDTPEHPLCVKKGAFLDKLGGYCTQTSKEDLANCIYPITFNDPIYIDSPCYMRCVMADEEGYMASGTIDVCKTNNAEYEENYLLDVFRKIYDRIGFDGEIVPKHIRLS